MFRQALYKLLIIWTMRGGCIYPAASTLQWSLLSVLPTTVWLKNVYSLIQGQAARCFGQCARESIQNDPAEMCTVSVTISIRTEIRSEHLSVTVCNRRGQLRWCAAFDASIYVLVPWTSGKDVVFINQPLTFRSNQPFPPPPLSLPEMTKRT